MIDDEAAAVIRGHPPAERAQHRREPVGARGFDRGGKPGQEPVPGTEGDGRLRPVDPQHTRPLPGPHLIEQHAGQGERIDRVVGPAPEAVQPDAGRRRLAIGQGRGSGRVGSRGRGIRRLGGISGPGGCVTGVSVGHQDRITAAAPAPARRIRRIRPRRRIRRRQPPPAASSSNQTGEARRLTSSMSEPMSIVEM